MSTILRFLQQARTARGVLLLLVFGIFSSGTNATAQNFWQQTNGPSSNQVAVRALAVNTATNYLFAGTNAGVFRSTNNGGSWTQINAGLTNTDVWAFAINTNGDVFTGTYGGGVFRSKDNGSNWTPVNVGLTDMLVLALSINNHGDIFAGTRSQGVFRSTDNGGNWAQVNNGLTDSFVQTFTRNDSGAIFVGTLDGGVFRSRDNGDNWVQVNSGLTNTHISSLAINANGEIFAGTVFGGIFRSTTDGDSWTLVNADLTNTNVRALAINASGVIFAGTGGRGVFRSRDNGGSWETLNAGLTDTIAVSFAFNTGGIIFAGTTAVNGVFRSATSTFQIAVQDSLALMNFYNSTDGASWANKTNWLSSAPISAWFGVMVQGNRVTRLGLSENQIAGSIPSAIGNLTKLTILSLSTNLLTGAVPVAIRNCTSLQSLIIENNSLLDLPDLSSMPALSFLSIGSNQFTFEDIEPNIGVANFSYSPQDSVGVAQNIVLGTGARFTLSVAVGGANNQYQWRKNSVPIPFATSSTYIVTQADSTRDTGIYICEITNTVATACTLTSRPITLHVVENALSVTHTPATANNAVTVTVNLNVAFQPTTSQLFYRRAGEIDFQVTTLNQTGNQFSGTIPANFITMRGAEYYVSLSNAQTLFTFPETDPEFIPQVLQVHFGQLDYPLTLQPEVYKMISVPVELNSSRIDSVLLDNYGQYEVLPRQWRIFRWENDDYAEHTNIEALFAPGNAFWLITRDGKSFNTGRGQSMNSAEPVEIILQPGWNQIANPFAFPVDWRFADAGDSIQTPVFYDGTQYLFDRNILDPWEGYFVLNQNNTPAPIFISPIVTSRAASKISERFNFSGEDIVLQIAAVIPGTKMIDSENYLGLRENARAGSDALDFYEPPPIGEFVRLILSEDGREFAGNFKPLNAQGQQWEVQVTSSRRETEVQIQLHEMTHLPENFQIYVLDQEQREVIAANDHRFTIKISKAFPTRHLKIVVGTPAFAEQSAGNISLLPIAFALYQNYPNPFRSEATSHFAGNPESVIKYQISKPGRVKLEIFNLMGQKIKTLVDEERNPGVYSAQWEGLDETGRAVASGVYFYRLTAGEFTATSKLVLSR